jgi:hypothetical protein
MDSFAFRGKGTILFSTVLFIFTGMAEEFMFRGITGIIGSYGLTHLLSLIPYAVVLIVILRPGKMKEIAAKFAPQ